MESQGKKLCGGKIVNDADTDLDQLNVYLIETTMEIVISAPAYKKDEIKILLKKSIV